MKYRITLTFVWIINMVPFHSSAQWQILNYNLFSAKEVKFHDLDKGAVLTGTMLLVTHNGGTTFDTVFFNPTSPLNKSLNLIDATTIAFQKGNKLFLSANFGITWDSVMLLQNFNNLVFLNDTVVIGQLGSSLLRSNNRGVTWQTLLTGLNTNSFLYEFPHPDTGYVSDGDSIMFTYNGGITWSFQLSIPGYGVHFPSDSTWYGVRNSQDSISIIKTTDKGATWINCLQAFTPLTYITDISFLDKETGYISGIKYFSFTPAGCGVLLGTGNGGATWDWHNNLNCFGEMLVDIHCLNPDTIFGLEFNGMLYRTTNGSDYTRRVEGVYATSPHYEPCGKGSLNVLLNFPVKDTLVVHYDAMYGTASDGVDFAHIPDSMIFMPGMQIIEIPIVVIDDTLAEVAEFFSIVIYNTLYSDTATFWIHDAVPAPFMCSINPKEQIVCDTSPGTSFVASLAGGVTPYSVIWYDTSGILSQNSTLHTQPILPWHRKFFVEMIDKALCTPILDSVMLYFFDSCNLAIQSSHIGQVPIGLPVTYTLKHSCPTNNNIRWLINQQLYAQNTNQIVYTWNTAGQQQVNAFVNHPCGFISTGIAVDVVTGIEGVNPLDQLQLNQMDVKTWKILGENLAGKLTLRVMDMAGRQITSEMLMPEGGSLHFTLSLNHLGGGLYLIEIVSEQGFRYREKIVCR